jgi:hypothetical protein
MIDGTSGEGFNVPRDKKSHLYFYLSRNAVIFNDMASNWGIYLECCIVKHICSTGSYWPTFLIRTDSFIDISVRWSQI